MFYTDLVRHPGASQRIEHLVPEVRKDHLVAGISQEPDQEDKLLPFQRVQLAERIIERFEKIEQRSWGAEGAMIELQKQVGELAKLIMVQEKYYFDKRNELDPKYEANKEKIADELADILYAIIRLAKHYNIDLLDAHLKAREKEDEFLKSNS